MATVPTLINAKSRTVVTASNKFTDAVKPRQLYRIIGDVDFWFSLEPEGGACVASENGAILAAAGEALYFAPHEGSGLFLHVIRAAGVDGNVNLAEVVEVEV